MQTEAAEFIGAPPAALKKRITKRIKKVATSSSSEMDFPKRADSADHWRTDDQPPLIFHPEATRKPEAEDSELLRAYRESLTDDRRMLLGRYRLVDAAIKVVGVGQRHVLAHAPAQLASWP